MASFEVFCIAQTIGIILMLQSIHHGHLNSGCDKSFGKNNQVLVSRKCISIVFSNLWYPKNQHSVVHSSIMDSTQ